MKLLVQIVVWVLSSPGLQSNELSPSGYTWSWLDCILAPGRIHIGRFLAHSGLGQNVLEGQGNFTCGCSVCSKLQVEDVVMLYIWYKYVCVCVCVHYSCMCRSPSACSVLVAASVPLEVFMNYVDVLVTVASFVEVIFFWAFRTEMGVNPMYSSCTILSCMSCNSLQPCDPSHSRDWLSSIETVISVIDQLNMLNSVNMMFEKDRCREASSKQRFLITWALRLFRLLRIGKLARAIRMVAMNSVWLGVLLESKWVPIDSFALHFRQVWLCIGN